MLERIGRYEVVREIARGGMGVVYEARDPTSLRRVAIKVLVSAARDARFVQEIQALARLHHPGIVTFFHAEQDPTGIDYVVMELVEGESLADRLERAGPLPIDEAVSLVRKLCEVLAYAHARGVLHRDLKPANVLVTGPGQVKLTDFGLGKVVDLRADDELDDPTRGLTQTGDMLGTPAYMPPEQVGGELERIGPRSDVYGLGATAFALVTGEPPFRGTTVINTLHAVLRTQAPLASSRRPEVPAELDAVLGRCLAKEPEQRYPDMAALAAALEGIDGPAAATAWPSGLAETVAPPRAETVAPPRGETVAPPRAETVAPPRAETVAPPRAETVAQVMRGASPGPWVRALAGLLIAAGVLGAAWLLSQRPATQPADEALAARIAQAEALRAAGDVSQAIAVYEGVVARDPQSAPGWLGLAQARYHAERYPQALTAAERAVAAAPDGWEGYAVRAQARMGAVAQVDFGELELALADFDRAMALAPGRVEPRLARGWLCLQVYRLDEARQAFTVALELEPGSAEAQVGLGAVANLSRDPEEALRRYDEALRRDPANLRARRERGVLLLRRGRRVEAEKDYEVLKTLPGREPEVMHVTWAQARLDVGDLDGVIRECDQGISANPRLASLFVLRAVAYLRQGRRDQARADVGRALELDPGFRLPPPLEALTPG